MILLKRVFLILAIALYSFPIESTSYAVTKETPEKRVNAFEFFKFHECRGGPKLIAYPDYKGYSIGCGTPSYKGEKITEKQAYDRLEKYVNTSLEVVGRHYPKATYSQRVALASLHGNNNTCYQYFRKNGINEYIWREKCDNVRKDGKLVELRGLHLRRNQEADLYFKK